MLKHKGTVTLETERLILRRFKPDDAEAMYANWCADPDVTKYLMWPTHSSIDESRKVLTNIWLSHYDESNFYQWAIEVKDINEPIGSIGVVKHDDKVQMVHLGYCIGKAWWRNGYTSEALCRLVKFFFEDVGVNRIESRHDPRNPNSGKVMQKAELRYEGTSMQSDWNNQGICDAANYAILARDYFKKSCEKTEGYIMDLRKIVGNRPLIQVGASIIVDNGKGEILLERRKDNGLWEYPAGSMDLGESLDETAKRELLEETGLIAQDMMLYEFLNTDTPRNVYPNGDIVYNVIGRYVCTKWIRPLKGCQ